MGVSTERALLYHLLAEPWNLSGAGPRNVLQGGCTADNFRNQLDRFSDDYTIDSGMAEVFLTLLKKDRKLKNHFFALCDHYHRADAEVSPDISQQRSDLVGDLRATLARACLHALKPDLIILDEFQRFKDLLVENPDSEASQLAHDLFRLRPTQRHACADAVGYALQDVHNGPRTGRRRPLCRLSGHRAVPFRRSHQDKGDGEPSEGVSTVALPTQPGRLAANHGVDRSWSDAYAASCAAPSGLP